MGPEHLVWADLVIECIYRAESASLWFRRWALALKASFLGSHPLAQIHAGLFDEVVQQGGNRD